MTDDTPEASKMMQDTVCMPEPENQGWVDGIAR
jgi:hypothetical protein